MKQRTVNMFKIADDQWTVIEVTERDQDDLYIVLKDGLPTYEIAGGGQYETESGAYYAIINEYKLKRAR